MATSPSKKPVRVRREKRTNQNGLYVRNADLLPEIARAKALGQVTPELIKMIERIAIRYSMKYNFVGYSYRTDMVSCAVENLCKNALKFDNVKYSNPFAYYTTAIHNSFILFIGEEKREQQLRDRLLVEAGANPSFGYSDDSAECAITRDEFSIPESDNFYVSHSPDDEGQPTEEKIRYASHMPGEMVTMAGSEVELDPVTGCYRRKVSA